MAKVTRTVRFKKEEADLIGRFLKENPIFDFSSLARTALLEFIKNPILKIRPVGAKPDGRPRSARD